MTAEDPLEHVAREIVEAMVRGDTARASGHFDARLRAALPPEALVGAWSAAVDRFGPFVAIDGVTHGTEGGVAVAHVRFHMQKGRMIVRVVFDAAGDVAGLWLRPAPPETATDWTPPAYADRASFDERDVKVGASPALPGVLSVPKGAHGVPGVVLVHGSGPNGRDEVVGATSVFRDLAWGLASRGIAVVRYDKRTLVDPRGVTTQKEEILDGAAAAIALLRATPEVDPARVFVVGHSEGGTVAPRIAKEDGRLAGVVLLAGATRPLQDAMVAQLEYLRSLAPGEAALGALVEDAKRFKAAVEDPGLRPDATVAVPGGGTIPGAYLLDLRAQHPAETAASLACPILVLQGERDYQVTMQDDFAGWKRALARSPRATFRSYPALDHRFVAGEGPSSPAQYAAPGHVDARVVEDIARWVETGK